MLFGGFSVIVTTRHLKSQDPDRRRVFVPSTLSVPKHAHSRIFVTIRNCQDGVVVHNPVPYSADLASCIVMPGTTDLLHGSKPSGCHITIRKEIWGRRLTTSQCKRCKHFSQPLTRSSGRTSHCSQSVGAAHRPAPAPGNI